MRDENASYFDKSCKQHKDCGWAAALWCSEEDQIGRFALLAKMLSGPFPPENSYILDVGCGQGDLYGFLRNRGIKNNYIGIDVSSEMIGYAKKKYPDGDFILEDFSTYDFENLKFGYVMCNGMFSVKINNQLDVVKNCIYKMYDLSENALSINFLSDEAPDEQKFEEYYFYYSPIDILKCCFELTTDVKLDHSYCDHEFMITIYK